VGQQQVVCVKEMTYRNDGLVTDGTLFREPFTKTTESDTSRPPDNDIGIIETSLNCRPETVDMRSNVLATSLHSDTESHESRLSHSRIGRAHVDL
jgi:hypothetical protein